MYEELNNTQCVVCYDHWTLNISVQLTGDLRFITGLLPGNRSLITR